MVCTMKLCIDAGNTITHFGLFNNENLILKFECESNLNEIYFKHLIEKKFVENYVSHRSIHYIIICSVVPEIDELLKIICLEYFKIEPVFLTSAIQTCLKIHYNDPNEVGADRLANAVGALTLYPNKDLIIVDMGTATTICAISKEKEFFGGAILPGLMTSAYSLSAATSKLPHIKIIEPFPQIGRSTIENIQVGLFYGHLGAVKEIIIHLTNQIFNNKNYKVIVTGGICSIYKDENSFDYLVPDLALIGLNNFYPKQI